MSVSLPVPLHLSPCLLHQAFNIHCTHLLSEAFTLSSITAQEAHINKILLLHSCHFCPVTNLVTAECLEVADV